MAAAYAALVTLMNVINRVQDPTCPATFDKSQIKALFDKVSLLVHFLEAYYPSISKDLERKITDAAYAAQDHIESCVVVKIRPSSGSRHPWKPWANTLDRLSSEDLEKAIQGVDLVLQEAMEVENKIDDRLATERVDKIRQIFGFLHRSLNNGIKRWVPSIQKSLKVKQREQPRSAHNVGSEVPPTGTIEILGFGGELNQLLERLVTSQRRRETFPIVGMGGIGKSTLARSVYYHPYVQDHFHVKAWVTISRVYDIGTIIRPLLHEFGIRHVDDEQLGDTLHKYLFGRKYLIILDDIWDIQARDLIWRFLPDNKNGSRILLTTRILSVARSVGSCNPYEIKLLNDDQSWDLLSKMAFGKDACPPELETYGKKIATSCKGLPLSVVVIVGILKKSKNALEHWEHVAKNTTSIISRGDNEHCLRILSLSYHELPIHLKPCFLYMATFPEDYEIRVSEVIMLWVADGFLKPNGDDTLEEAASENLNDLISRNLIMVKKKDSRGRMKCLVLHDLVRDLSLREAQKERFVHVDNSVRAIGIQHRLVLHHSSPVSFPTKQQERARSFMSFLKWSDPPDMTSLSLARVYSAAYIGRTGGDIMQLANLRFIKSIADHLFLDPSHGYPFGKCLVCSSISFFWNLETLILDLPQGSEMYSLSVEVWKLPHIKHIIFSRGVIFPDPPTAHTDSVLGKLHTLKNVIISSNEVLYRIPNIKNMWILSPYDFSEERQPCSLFNLVHCHKLETLYLRGRITFDSGELNINKSFLNSLKKLTLSSCNILWERMTIVGSLPNLEVLKLKMDAFVGETWESVEGEFQRLKYLSMIYQSDLVTWSVENSSHFPCLEHLILRWMNSFIEVPLVFGESMTLKTIQLDNCEDSAVISAKQILDEQDSTGNFDLEVHVQAGFRHKDKKRKMKLESLASDRFHVKCLDWS